MKPEELTDILHDVIVDRLTVVTAVEELRTLGYNLVNFLLDLGPAVDYAAISFRYSYLHDELEPIAVVIHPNKSKASSLDLNKVLAVLREIRGFLYSGHDVAGFLIPVYQEEQLREVLVAKVPYIIESLFGYTVKPKIVGYTLELQENSWLHIGKPPFPANSP